MTTRKYVGRAWSPARTLSVLDLKGRLVEMLSHAERQGLSDHMELLAKLLARPTHRDPPELERTEALQHFDRLVEDAEALTTAFEAMESDAASICCSMEAEGIVEASQRARAAFEGRQVLAHGPGGRLGVLRRTQVHSSIWQTRLAQGVKEVIEVLLVPVLECTVPIRLPVFEPSARKVRHIGLCDT
jgi:hypothetical protein